MASTTYAKIVKPVSEHDSNKIVTLNTGTDDVDLLTCGFLPLDIAGTGDIVLTRAQAINKTFKFTGALTGAARAVLFPVSLGCSENFTVWNATTGAVPLTIKTTTGGSTGVVVTINKKVNLFHDGTNVYASSAEV